jgi:acetyl-CoA carboxylase carboxyl transferase subunit alpha
MSDVTPELEAKWAAAFKRVQMARHPERPYTLDFVRLLFEDFTELHGDRRYSDDPAIVCGWATYHGEPVMIVGQQKGRDIKERSHRNFAMTKPEGYRKALRFMQMAAKFGRPVLTFVDTPGAYPGIDAEERGQAEAIAYNLREMFKLRVPVVVTVIGEGGSGGALAIAVGDQILMMENAIYSVITPEGCAAILWKNAAQAPRASYELHITADDLHGFGIVDTIIPEPGEGAHTDHETAAQIVDKHIKNALAAAKTGTPDERMNRRYDKLRQLGKWGNS